VAVVVDVVSKVLRLAQGFVLRFMDVPHSPPSFPSAR
jgi:hypothetical protein